MRSKLPVEPKLLHLSQRVSAPAWRELPAEQLDAAAGGGAVGDFFYGAGRGFVLGGFANDGGPVSSAQSWGQTFGHLGSWGAAIAASPVTGGGSLAVVSARDTAAGLYHASQAETGTGVALGLAEAGLSALPAAGPIARAGGAAIRGVAEFAAPGALDVASAEARNVLGTLGRESFDAGVQRASTTFSEMTPRNSGTLADGSRVDAFTSPVINAEGEIVSNASHFNRPSDLQRVGLDGLGLEGPVPVPHVHPEGMSNIAIPATPGQILEAGGVRGFSSEAGAGVNPGPAVAGTGSPLASVGWQQEQQPGGVDQAQLNQQQLQGYEDLASPGANNGGFNQAEYNQQQLQGYEDLASPGANNGGFNQAEYNQQQLQGYEDLASPGANNVANNGGFDQATYNQQQLQGYEDLASPGANNGGGGNDFNQAEYNQQQLQGYEDLASPTTSEQPQESYE